MSDTEYKSCNRCLEMKSTNCFQRDKSKRDGLYPTCKDCISRIRRERYQQNPKKYKEQARRGREKNPQKAKERTKRYRLTHPDMMREARQRWKEQYPDKDRAAKKKWEQNNPDKVREKARRHRKNNPALYVEYKHKRRSKENELPCEMTQAAWNFMFEYWDNKCCICGQQDVSLTRDHWVPIKDKKGREIGTVPENMLPLCRNCNCTKSNKDPIEWLYSKYPQQEADIILQAIKNYFEHVGKSWKGTEDDI